MLGLAFTDLGRIEEAILDYTKAIEMNPMDDLVYYNRGYYYFYIFKANAMNDLGRKEEAIKDYTRAIEINPQ